MRPTAARPRPERGPSIPPGGGRVRAGRHAWRRRGRLGHGRVHAGTRCRAARCVRRGLDGRVGAVVFEEGVEPCFAVQGRRGEARGLDPDGARVGEGPGRVGRRSRRGVELPHRGSKRRRGGVVDPAVATRALLADVDEDAGRLDRERLPVLAALVERHAQEPRDVAQKLTGGIAVAAPQSVAQRLLPQGLAAELEGGGHGRSRRGQRARPLERRDLEARERGQQLLGDVGRDRHRLLRERGEDPLDHRREASGEDLRVGGDVRSQREGQKRPGEESLPSVAASVARPSPAPEIAARAALEVGLSGPCRAYGRAPCAPGCAPRRCTGAHARPMGATPVGDRRASSGGWRRDGSGGRDRTYDQLINSQLLYR